MMAADTNPETAIPLGRRERKKLAVRDKIIEESIALVAIHGVEGTTIDAICDCADIAKKTFYNYYSAKHDLLTDICRSHLLERASDLIDESLASSPGLAGRLDYAFTQLAQRNRAAGKLERELIDYMVGSLSDNRTEGASQLSFLNNCFYRLYSASEPSLKSGLSAEFCAEMTVGMVNAITLNWLHNEDYDSDSRYRQLLNYIKASMIDTP